MNPFELASGGGVLVEVQLLQSIVQVGALGILVYLVIWFTRTYIPAQRDERQHERTEAAAERTHQAAAREALQEAYEASAVQQRADADARAKQQREDYLASLRQIREEQVRDAEECRKERRDLYKQMQQDRELDRTSRHELGSMFQKAIAEIHTHALAIPSPRQSDTDDRRPRSDGPTRPG